LKQVNGVMPGHWTKSRRQIQINLPER